MVMRDFAEPPSPYKNHICYLILSLLSFYFYFLFLPISSSVCIVLYIAFSILCESVSPLIFSSRQNLTLLRDGKSN